MEKLGIMLKLVYMAMVISAILLFLNIAVYVWTWMIIWPQPQAGIIPVQILLLLPLFVIWLLLIIVFTDYIIKNNIGWLFSSFYLWILIFKNCPRLFFALLGTVIFLIINIHLFAYEGADPNHAYRVTASLGAVFYTFAIAFSYAYAEQIKADKMGTDKMGTQ